MWLRFEAPYRAGLFCALVSWLTAMPTVEWATLGLGIGFGVRRVIVLGYSLFSRRIEASGGWVG